MSKIGRDILFGKQQRVSRESIGLVFWDVVERDVTVGKEDNTIKI
jgi:hypothetical protein